MLRARFVVIVVAVLGGSISAQQGKACGPPSQMQMSAGAGSDAAKADKALNDVYQEILKQYADDPVFLKKLKVAQQAWLKFRDAELDATYPHADEPGYYGSVYSTCRGTALASLTSARTRELRVWLDGVEEGEACAGSVKPQSQLKP